MDVAARAVLTGTVCQGNKRPLVDHFPVDDFVRGIEMRNLERPHRLDSECEDFFRFASPFAAAESLARGAQGAQHLRAVESLALTMITETHDGLTIVTDYHFSRTL